MDEVDNESERVSARNVLVDVALGLCCLDCIGDRMVELPSSRTLSTNSDASPGLGVVRIGSSWAVISFTIKRLLESLPIAMADALLDRSLVAPVLALQFRLFPLLAFPLLLVRFRWLQSYGDLIALDGLKGWALEKRFLFGNIHVVIAILLLGMAVAVSELASYLLLLPAGVCPLAMRIFELLHYGVRYKEAGLCLFLAFIGMTTGWLARWLVLYRPIGR